MLVGPYSLPCLQGRAGVGSLLIIKQELYPLT
jgi:hypothetical protein